jgi:plasmid stabilization system protein ParE
VIGRHRVVWRRAAVRDLIEIADWVSVTPNGDPIGVRDAIQAAVDRLARLGDIGRPARANPNLRVLSVQTKPYLVAYVIQDDQVDIIAVIGTRTRRAVRY